MSTKKKSGETQRNIHITNGNYFENLKIEGGVHFYPQNRQDLIKVFPIMYGIVQQSQVEPDRKADIVQKIREAEQEVAKPAPDKQVIAGHLKDLQTVIKTAAAAIGTADAIQKLIPLVKSTIEWIQNNLP